MSALGEQDRQGAGAGPAPVQRSIATISLSGPLEEKLTAAARAGFDGIEIFEGDLITSRLSPADVRLRAADLGLRILLYQPFRDYEAVPDDLLLNMDTLAWSRHYRCFPGQGGFDLCGLAAHVLASGYHGPWSLEVFNDVFRQADAKRTAIDGMRSLLTLEESLTSEAGRITSPPAPATGPPGPVTLADLPAPPELPGYAFVEIGVDALIEPAAEHLLRRLGFARTGVHRTKPVQLWQQAGARVLVNRTGTDGDGRPRGDAAVSAIAVESQDPGRSARRAQALLAPPIPRYLGPHEAELTAVAAPDGTSVFSCQT